MTPYELEETKRMAIRAIAEQDAAPVYQLHIFRMLCALLQHEADKEAARRRAEPR